MAIVFRGVGRWCRRSGRQLSVAGAAACVVAAVLQTRLWAHGVFRGLWERQCLCWVSCRGSLPPPGWRHQRGGEERGGVAVLGLRGGREGRRRRDKWLGKLPVLSPASPGNCCLLARGARQGPQHRVAGRGGVKRGWRSFGPLPQAVAQFPRSVFDRLLPSPYLSSVPLQGW